MSREIKGADVAVVGGGAVGCAVAREVARSGLSVAVVERGRPGREATWAGAGMLSPLGEAGRPGAFLSLALDGLRLHEDLAPELQAETGLDVRFRRVGKLMVALDEAALVELRHRHDWQSARGHAAEWVPPERIHELEPAVSPGVLGGLLLPDDARVDNRVLGAALWSAAERAGCRFLAGSRVRGIRVRQGRVQGVELEGGDAVEARQVVVAAGAWSGALGGLPRPLPVRPVRGQMLALEALPPPARRMLESPGIYLIPREDGRVLAGATVEEAGFDVSVTAGGILELLLAALSVLPCLGAARLVETWTGLRPGTPDGLPILGPDPEVQGLVYATGHFRNGLLLSLVTGRLVARLLGGEVGGPELDPFAPGRFAPHEP